MMLAVAKKSSRCDNKRRREIKAEGQTIVCTLTEFNSKNQQNLISDQHNFRVKYV